MISSLLILLKIVAFYKRRSSQHIVEKMFPMKIQFHKILKTLFDVF